MTSRAAVANGAAMAKLLPKKINTHVLINPVRFMKPRKIRNFEPDIQS